jgi:lipopolysaccharide export system ATP-binding protein
MIAACAGRRRSHPARRPADITPSRCHAAPSSGVGYLPQEPSCFRKLSVADNLRLVLELRQDSSATAARRELKVLLTNCRSPTSPTDSAPACPAASGGAWKSPRALAAKPRLMLLDDPSPASTRFRSARSKRSSAISESRHRRADHRPQRRETLGICDRAYILNEGGVLAQGSGRAAANPDVRRVYLGETFRR